MEPLATTLPPASPAPAGRPFSAGEVIGRSFSVWFRNFVPFSVVTLVVNLPVLVLAAVVPEDAGAGWRILLNLVNALVELVIAGALTYGVLESLRGERVPLGTLLGTGFSKLGRVFLVSVAVGLRVLLGFMLLVVPGIVFLCQLYVAVPAAVVEPDVGLEAIPRSRALTAGNRWGIFVIVLVGLLVTIAVGGVAGVLALLGASALPGPAVAVLVTAIGALASPFGACAAAVAYHDLRVAKEGVDTATLVKVFE